jgi:methionine salvage enolase-phosphatase E1
MGVWIYTSLAVLSDEIAKVEARLVCELRNADALSDSRKDYLATRLDKAAKVGQQDRDALLALASQTREYATKLEALAQVQGYVWAVGTTTETVRKSHWQPVARVVTEEKP